MAKGGYGAERKSGGGKVGGQSATGGKCYGDGSKVGFQGSSGLGSGAKVGGQGGSKSSDKK